MNTAIKPEMTQEIIDAAQEALSALSDSEVILRLASMDGVYMPVSGQAQKRAQAAYRRLTDALKEQGISRF